MSRRQFTEEQQRKLRQNPYVYSVTACPLLQLWGYKARFVVRCREFIDIPVFL